MDCTMPPPLSEDQLSALLDDTTDAALQDHLTHCPFCSARLAEARRFDARLRRSLARFDCPSAGQLGDYALGLLDAGDHRRVLLHLNECAVCQEELATAQAFLAESVTA